jgi:xylulose-5-phosphate/fructose-6-phosphate phosphoketolase
MEAASDKSSGFFGLGSNWPICCALDALPGAARTHEVASHIQLWQSHGDLDRRRNALGLSDAEFDALFTVDRPIIFAYHGYPWLIHRLTYRRTNHGNLHVRGYKEEGTTTTPFDMVVMNDMDRFHLVMDVIDRVPGLGQRAAGIRQLMVDKRAEHHAWTRRYGDDPPEVRDWAWQS